MLTGSCQGAGKSHVMGLLGERSIFPMEAFVQVDPDRLRRELPEMEGYVRQDSRTAGSLTHKEVKRGGWAAVIDGGCTGCWQY